MGSFAGLLSAAAYRCWRPVVRRRLGRTVLEWVDGVPVVVLPEVFNPKVFRTGAWLARAVAGLPALSPESAPASGRSLGAPRALDMGTGSGIGAVFAARRGYRVTAVDVNPHAVRCARLNSALNGLEERIEVRQGDLFAAVAGERFDLVLFNPPFFRGAPRGPLDAAWRSQDVIERFAAGLPAALAPGGRALLLLSSAGGADGVMAAHAPPGLRLTVLSRRGFAGETITLFEAGARCEVAPAAAAATRPVEAHGAAGAARAPAGWCPLLVAVTVWAVGVGCPALAALAMMATVMAVPL
jgi:HemK-related putative methylase